MKTLSTLVVTLTACVALVGCGPNQKEIQLQKFITTHVEKVKPMHKETSLAYWDAATSGKAEDYEKVSELTLKIRQWFCFSQGTERIRAGKEAHIGSAIGYAA